MKKGFTLIELLTALAIIGVIVVLTVPNLVDNYSKRSYVSTLQTINAGIKNAVNSTFTRERVPSLTDSSLGSSPQIFLQRYFKLASDCGFNYTGCLAETYKSLDKTATTRSSNMLSGNNFYCVTLQNGAAICMTTMSSDNSTTRGKSIVVIDLNGKKNPNTNGRDLFSFEIYSDGKIGNQYEITENDANGTSCNNYASTAGYGGACYSKIVADGWKMNY